eukprot:COSAG02_NODE_214_length_28689_cov_34.895523_6_plen_333_part_00
MLTTTERYVGLETTAITVDILWRSKVSNPWQQFAATLPAQPSRGYTATQIKDDLNTIVGDYLYQNHSIGPTTSPYNVMISNIQVFPGTEPHTYQIKTDYTDETLVKVRGDMYDSTDLSGLPAGQLRSGLPNPAYAGPPLGGEDGWAFIGNPYGTHTGYVAALMHPVANAATSGVTSAGPTIQEIQTAMFLTSCGFVGQGVRGGNFNDVDSIFGSGLTFFRNTSNLHDATAKTAAHIDAVTEIGLAVEPIVQGPRDTSGKTSGTLARFSIPKGTSPGDIIPFEAAVPTKVSVQQFVGSEIGKLTFRLVDQNNDAISDLAGEHFSAVVVFSYDN